MLNMHGRTIMPHGKTSNQDTNPGPTPWTEYIVLWMCCFFFHALTKARVDWLKHRHTCTIAVSTCWFIKISLSNDYASRKYPFKMIPLFTVVTCNPWPQTISCRHTQRTVNITVIWSSSLLPVLSWANRPRNRYRRLHIWIIFSEAADCCFLIPLPFPQHLPLPLPLTLLASLSNLFLFFSSSCSLFFLSLLSSSLYLLHFDSR